MKRSFVFSFSFFAASVFLFLLASCTGPSSYQHDRGYSQSSIVILPFYVEEGRDTSQGGRSTLHYRRMLGFIENQLVSHDFEVIDPFAMDATEKEYNRIMERAREDSSLASVEMCKKYGTDAAYIVWMKLKFKRTADGFCKASVILDGKGYDSGARSLGANIYKTFKVTKRDCDEAISKVEVEVGDLVGRKLTAWSENRHRSTEVSSSSQTAESRGEGEGVLARNIRKNENLINIRLDGATEYELTEVFGKVINTVTGVVEAKRFSSQIIPDNPQACFVNWRVRIEDTEPFRLQANVMKMVNDILDAGGKINLKGVPYRYTADEVTMLMGIRPGSTTTRMIQFVIDRDRVRDREFSGRHDPKKSRQKNKTNPAFE